MEQKRTLIHWFRKGLRIHDNPALLHIYQKALENPAQYWVRPIFILDPGIRDWMRVGANRLRFLQQTLEDLHQQLMKINLRLYVIRGKPAEVFPRLFKEWNTELLTFESDIEPFSKIRDDAVAKLAKAQNVHLEVFCSHTIYNPENVLKCNLGKAPLTYQKFLQIIDKLKTPKPVATPGTFPAETFPKLDELESANASCYDCPALEEIVARTSELGPNKYVGGETEGLKRLNTYISKEEWIAAFEKPNTSPNSLEPSTTVLSPYLKFGCLSSRLFHEQLTACLKKHTKHSKPPVSLLGQLLWREFYYTAAASEPNFDRMIGNPICLQIPWEENNAHLEAWTYGRTGYPFIDAIMRQLRQEGWIHHLARHAVACFLTRGDLWISWESGQKVFEELLLDQDWALNAGNWMWLSASAFFHQYFRVYSPIAFGKKTDPKGVYIKKYVPELAKYPSEHIYEPWKLSLKEQRNYDCVIGEDYPHRIVKHEIIHKINIKRMSDAYKINREVNTGKSQSSETNKDQSGAAIESKKRKKQTSMSTFTKKSRN